MKRIVRGVCGLLSAVMLLSTTAMAADYTPVVTSDERVKGFYNVYNGENASLQMELAGRYNSGAMSEEGGSLRQSGDCAVQRQKRLCLRRQRPQGYADRN